jgi:hypothetical protein
MFIIKSTSTMSSVTHSATNAMACAHCGIVVHSGIVANGRPYCGIPCRDIANTYPHPHVPHPPQIQPNPCAWTSPACVACMGPADVPFSSNIGNTCSTRCLITANQRFAHDNQHNHQLFRCAGCTTNYSFASHCDRMIVRVNAYYCSKDCASMTTPAAPLAPITPRVPAPPVHSAPHVVSVHPIGLMMPHDTCYGILAPRLVSVPIRAKTVRNIPVAVALPHPGQLFTANGFSHAGQFVVVPRK